MRSKSTRLLGLAAFAVTLGGASICPAPGQLARNAVGYTRLSIPAGGLALGRMDFDSLNGTPAVVSDGVFFEPSMTNRAVLYAFDNVTQRYILESRTPMGWRPGTNVLRRGHGFWVHIQSLRARTNFSLYLMGNVPTSRTTSVSITRGLNLVGYPYPVNMTWNNTQLAKNREAGQAAYFFNTSNQAYTVVWSTSTGWSANPIIRPGEGFWFKSSKAFIWSEAKPYTWP